MQMDTINKDTELSLAAYCTLGAYTPDDDNMLLMEANLSSSVNALPDEIIEFILTYLPPYGDLNNCNLVCKRWNNIVKNLVRRSKLNLHKGLNDYRLLWEIFSQQTAAATAKRNHLHQQEEYHQLPSTSNAVSNGAAHAPIIAGRFSHSAVFYDNSMYIFGGGSSSDTTFNDLWRFDLTRMCWERPVSMGSYPSPKGSASMVQWREQLILFGGWRYPSLHPPYQPWCLFDELHLYDLRNNRWNICYTQPSPPPMAGHSATVHGDRMIIFGGYQIADGINSNSNQTWCFELTTQKWWQPRILSNIRPPPRYGQFQLVLDEQHMLIVGGCGGPNSVYSDAWLLDMSKDSVWSWRTVQVRNKEFAASHMWCHPACEIDGKLVVLGPSPNMPQDFQMKNQIPRILGHGHGAVRGLQGAVLPLAAHYEPNVPYRGGGGLAALPQNQRGLIENNGNNNEAAGRRDYFAFRRAILNQHQFQRQQQNRINNNNNNDNNQNNNNNNLNNNLFNNNNRNNNLYNNNNCYGAHINQILQPRTGRLSELRAAGAGAVPLEESQQRNRPSPSNATRLNANSAAATVSPPAAENEVSTNNGSPDMEAANRLQRNLALRCRENDPMLPKRFDELYEDPPRMAAFKEEATLRNQSKDHNERIRRLEEKMNAIRSRRNAHNNEIKTIKEPSPKRVKRNVLSLFVCDLSTAMDEQDPHLSWMEYKNYGIIPGAPERLILSTMVAGHGELILFGGVHKETLSELTHQVSNTIHFLSAPRDIV